MLDFLIVLEPVRRYIGARTLGHIGQYNRPVGVVTVG